ncbi:MAG: hypothetical protein HZB61_14605 [Nitrospirae bacterium]|nr:hypothetical protein [Nitrospirota bacterium]
MPITNSTSRSPVQRLLPSIFLLIVISIYSLLTIVVTMLVTGSLHLINKHFVHFEKINIITMIIAAAIIGTALMFFIKNTKKIYRSIEEQTGNRYSANNKT